MRKKGRRDPNEEHFLILRKLAIHREMRRGDFEEPRRRFKGVKEDLELGINRSKYIPHSSLRLRLDELSESNSVVEYNSGEKSKQGKPIMEYYLTFFGFIKLLQLCEKEKFYKDIFENSSRYLPKIIWIQMERLIKSKMISKEHLFFILIEISKNTSILIDYFPKESAGIIGNRVYRFPSSLLNEKIKWVHVHDIEIKIKQIENIFPIHKTFITHGKTNSKKDMREKDFKFMGDINRLFIFAFVNELIMRCYRTDDRFSRSDGGTKYFTEDEVPFLLEALKIGESIKKIYFEHIEEILYRHGMELDTMKNIKKSLKSKRSLISGKKSK